MTGDKNPRRKEGLTPLHQLGVHFEVYTYRQQNTLMSNYTEKMSLVPDD